MLQLPHLSLASPFMADLEVSYFELSHYEHILSDQHLKAFNLIMVVIRQCSLYTLSKQVGKSILTIK